jgi:hypothetical protein
MAAETQVSELTRSKQIVKEMDQVCEAVPVTPQNFRASHDDNYFTE